MHEAAKQLGITHQMLDYYRRAGKLTSVRNGSRWQIDPEVAMKELIAVGFYERKVLTRMKHRPVWLLQPPNNKPNR